MNYANPLQRQLPLPRTGSARNRRTHHPAPTPAMKLKDFCEHGVLCLETHGPLASTFSTGPLREKSVFKRSTLLHGRFFTKMRRGPDQANRKIPFTFQKHAQPGGDRLRGREGVGSGGVVGTLEPSRAEQELNLKFCGRSHCLDLLRVRTSTAWGLKQMVKKKEFEISLNKLRALTRKTRQHAVLVGTLCSSSSIEVNKSLE